MKLKYFFTVIMLVAVSLSFASCSRHDCVGLWEGGYVSNDNPYIHEQWDVRINNDGTCRAVNTVTGNTEYVDFCEGTWTPVTDDIIKLNMVAGERTSRIVTHSDLMKNNGRMTYRTSHQVYNFYLRKDGAYTPFVDHMDSPRAWLNKK